MEENDILIKCGNKSLNVAILSYIEDCDLDFMEYCRKKNLKIRYFDVDHEQNLIMID